MDLFEWSQNIMKVDQNKVINDSIKNENNELNGLTKDRMCKVYSSYVYNELKKKYHQKKQESQVTLQNV